MRFSLLPLICLSGSVLAQTSHQLLMDWSGESWNSAYLSNGNVVTAWPSVSYDTLNIWRSTNDGVPIWSKRVVTPYSGTGSGPCVRDINNGIFCMLDVEEDLQPGLPDTFSTKSTYFEMDASGYVLWASELRTELINQQASSLWSALTTDLDGNHFVLNVVNGLGDHVMITKYDDLGNHEWSRWVGEYLTPAFLPDVELNAMLCGWSVDGQGGVYIATVEDFAAPSYFYVMHVDATGTLDWSKRFAFPWGMSGSSWPSITFRINGNARMAHPGAFNMSNGLFQLEIDVQGGLVRADHIGFGYTGSVAQAERTSLDGAIYRAGYLVEVDSTGTPINVVKPVSTSTPPYTNTFGVYKVHEQNGSMALGGILTRTHQTVFTQTTYQSIWTGLLDPSQMCMLEAIPFTQYPLPDSLVTISDNPDDTAIVAVVQVNPMLLDVGSVTPVGTNEMCPFVVGIEEQSPPMVSLGSTVIEHGAPLVVVASGPGTAQLISASGSLVSADLKVVPGRNVLDAADLVAGMYLLHYRAEAGRADLKFIVR